MNKIISLQEVQHCRWIAKYRGNYGTYTIRLSTDVHGNVENYSCTCPSDYFPCKHIGFIKDAVAEHRTERERKNSGDAPTPEELLKNLSLDELRVFVLKQARYNDALRNAILLEFAAKVKSVSGNPYSNILRNALEDIQFDEDDLYEYDDMPIPIDVMDDLLEKAKSFVRDEKYDEAVSIAKACVEEFSSWYIEQDADVSESVDPNYSEQPFKILGEIADKNGCDAEALYKYCEEEIANEKYAKADMYDYINKLLLLLAKKTRNFEFLALQDRLLERERDKTSYNTEQILKHKMDFYNAVGQQEKADEIMEANLQVDNFRRAAVEKRIVSGELTEAKSIIFQYPFDEHFHPRNAWGKQLLTIAQKENDVPKIREIAFKFIENSYDKESYLIYRSAFSPEEWKDEVERLIRHYEPRVNDYWGYDSVAEVLATEGQTRRLLDYIAGHLTVKRLEQNYKYVCEQFPEETLLLFRKALNHYADENVGEKYYEHIASALRRMRKIPNGDTVVNEMLAQYRLLYKRRRAMIRVLAGV
jgi:hypothetical protein